MCTVCNCYSPLIARTPVKNSSFRFETLLQVPLLFEGLDDAFVCEFLAPLTAAIDATLSGVVWARRKSHPRTVARRRFGAILIEHLEPGSMMAAVPVARDDAAFYTNVGTDLVVTTSCSPAALPANDFDIDGGTLTSSVVTHPTSGSLINFGSNGTFTYRPYTSFVGIDSFRYKVNNGTCNSLVHLLPELERLGL